MTVYNRGESASQYETRDFLSQPRDVFLTAPRRAVTP